MTTNELRAAFQAFFEERGHLRVPPHSLIPPADDQTTLFIVAGMQQFKPYFLRTKEPPANRVVSVQPNATNLLNMVNYGTIDTVVNSNTFGQVLSVRGMRSMQVHLRFRF